MKSLSTRRRHPLAAFVVLVLALGFAGTLFAAFVSPTSADADSGTTATQTIENGKALYITSCSSCHGEMAEGSSYGPSLVGTGAAAVDFQVSTGRMPAQQPGAQIQKHPVEFTQAQIDEMAAYIASLGGGPAEPAANLYQPQDNLVQLGGVLFRTNCSQCHNFAGEGGVLTDGKFAPELTQTDPKAIYEAMLTGPQNMPNFPDTVISPAEKQAIISYIVSTRNEPNYGGAGLGRIGPTSEGLFIWTIGLIALLLVAVWIAAHTTKASAERVAKAAAKKGVK
ncbi:MAG TPA: c-type cytochrome [Actinospica sp.]|nr:c-type cytochrome [Actinospica sp.]